MLARRRGLSLIALVLCAGCQATIAKETPVSSPIVERISKAVAAQRRIAVKDIEVQVIDTGAPDCTAFTATQKVAGGGRGTYDTGVVTSSAVETNTQKAVETLVRAWGYGAKRTVPAAKVAQVVGRLEGASVQADTMPVVEQGALDSLAPARRAQAHLPKETTVDGQPAVEFFVRSPEPPLWKTTLVVGPGDKVTMTRQEIW